MSDLNNFEKRKKALKEIDDAYYDRTSQHYKDNERFSWAVETVNKKFLENMNDIISNLKNGDSIAFGFDYNGGEPKEIIVAQITEVYEKDVLVHFLYGHHSLGEFVKKENIIAKGDTNGVTKIKGWSGKYHLLIDSPLLKE